MSTYKTVVFDHSSIMELIDNREVLDAVEGAFRAYGLHQVQMPPKAYLFYHKYSGDLRTMPAYIEPTDATGVKIVNVHPNNKQRGLPTVMAVIVLNDPQTGYPIALMNGTYITALRTGAAGAVASKYLSKESSSVIGFIGCGVQAQTQLLMHVLVRNIRKVLAFDMNSATQDEFSQWVANNFKGLEVQRVSSIEEACQCDILNTVTPVKSPIVKQEFVRPGIHINAIGADAPGKQELASHILKTATIVIDDWEQAHHSGEINVPFSLGELTKNSVHAELGEIVAGKKPGRQSDNEITVFDSTGLGIQDIAVAQIVYTRGLDQKKGTIVDLFA